MSRLPLALLLPVYSLTLIVIELRTSQDFVRNFFADVTGPVPFYAINTTLSVFLLWSTALIFSLCCLLTEDLRERHFFVSQVVVFTYLGCDDRFLLHERILPYFGWDGGFLLLGIAVVEILFLFYLGNLQLMERSARYTIYGAAVLFAVMLILDLAAPQAMVLRLSLEDLCKLWSGALLFSFAWSICTGKIKHLKNAVERQQLSCDSVLLAESSNAALCRYLQS